MATNFSGAERAGGPPAQAARTWPDRRARSPLHKPSVFRPERNARIWREASRAASAATCCEGILKISLLAARTIFLPRLWSGIVSILVAHRVEITGTVANFPSGNIIWRPLATNGESELNIKEPWKEFGGLGSEVRDDCSNAICQTYLLTRSSGRTMISNGFGTSSCALCPALSKI